MGIALSHASRMWSMGQSEVERMENLRAITDSIGNEMRGALLPLDRTNLNSLQFVVNPITLTAPNYNGDTVFWQAPIATTGTAGDIAEVGYFVKWDTTKASNPKGILCRFFVNADGNSPSSAVPNSNYLIYTPSSSPGLLDAEWVSDSLLNAVAPGTSSPPPPAQAYQGLLAENVIGLWICCRDSFGQPIVTDFQGASLQVSGAVGHYGYDSRYGYTYTDPNSNSALYTPGYIPASSQTSSQTLQPLAALPREVDVGVVMVDSQAAPRITPAMTTAIDTVITSSSNAVTFVANARTNSALKPIFSNLRSYQTEVYLENSR